VSGYDLFRNGTSIGTTSATSRAFSGLICGTSYTLGVDAFDAAGNKSTASSVTASTAACPDTQAPTAPTGLLVTGSTGTSISISWSPSFDNVSVSGYDAYLGSTLAGTATTFTIYTFTGLTCGTSYTVAVDAFDPSGNNSTKASVTTSTAPCADTTKPSIPTGLIVTGSTSTSISLSWTSSTDNVGVTGYQASVNGSPAGTATATSYQFTGLSCGTSYTVGVAAVDAAGNASGTATTTTATSGCTSGASPSLANLYLTQNATGTGDGSSCGNAKAVSFFNTASNWGAGKPIAPGTTVGLCGTISTGLTAQGSGTAGNPITLLFEPNAKISLPVCNECLTLDGRSYITIDGGSNGIIESNANGTNLAHQSNSTGISADPCTNCTIENLTVQNMYVIASGDTKMCASGCQVDNGGAKCIRFSGANWSIHDNTFHDASWCLYEYGNGSDGNEQIYNNNIYNVDHGYTITGGGPYGKIYFHGNHVHDMGLYDACNGCHHDGIHCFFGGNGTSFAGSYIYDNTFDGTVGTDTTAWIFLEPNSGSACSSSGTWWVFNNRFSSSDEVPTNGYFGSYGALPAKVELYNNTFSGPGSGHFGNNQADCVYASDHFENNADGGCGQFLALDGTSDFNAYANATGTSNCFSAAGGTCNFATWQAAGHDAHGVFNSSGAVGSNVANVGTNLTSLCTGDLVPLCSDISGHPRPATGPWDAGAYEVSQ
jgi:chitodextrinase